MANAIEIRERQKHYLNGLLKLKKLNKDITVIGLEDLIKDAIVVMEQEDVAFVESVVGVKAL